MIELAKAARAAARILATTSAATKNTALQAMAAAIRQTADTILQANQQDILAAKNQSKVFLDRLLLTPERLAAMANTLEIIAAQSDPVGQTLATIHRPNGLAITRVSVPIGVIAVIYESRPNVTADAAGLCLKAGNAVILRSGSHSFHSATAIMKALQTGLAAANLPTAAIQHLPTADRADLQAMLKLEQYIDVIIPRGGKELIKFVTNNSRIPMFKHAAGLCHTYIHAGADLLMAKNIVINAKMRRPGICGATEVLLIDRGIARHALPIILEALTALGCEVRGDAEVKAIYPATHLASDQDYDTEFLAAIIGVKVVDNIDAAMMHITQHGTQHTDAIITDDNTAAEKFLRELDSAILVHNASTQFADGGEFGMGAEIGIATGKLHARGPIGAEQLTTFKYCVRGNGQVRGG